jgi:hypothetical protein
MGVGSSKSEVQPDKWRYGVPALYRPALQKLQPYFSYDLSVYHQTIRYSPDNTTALDPFLTLLDAFNKVNIKKKKINDRKDYYTIMVMKWAVNACNIWGLHYMDNKFSSEYYKRFISWTCTSEATYAKYDTRCKTEFAFVDCMLNSIGAIDLPMLFYYRLAMLHPVELDSLLAQNKELGFSVSRLAPCYKFCVEMMGSMRPFYVVLLHLFTADGTFRLNLTSIIAEFIRDINKYTDSYYIKKLIGKGSYETEMQQRYYMLWYLTQRAAYFGYKPCNKTNNTKYCEVLAAQVRRSVSSSIEKAPGYLIKDSYLRQCHGEILRSDRYHLNYYRAVLYCLT